MKKNQKWVNDNRGAALISIMIAVAFISILASALLYMAYTNFQMKKVNYESKVNFYETESNVVELSTAIRNTIATNETDPLGALKTAVGYYEDATTGATRYNPSYLAKMVYDSVTVSPVAMGYTVPVSDGSVFFSNNSSGSNFIVADNTTDSTIPAGEKKVTLKGVLISYTESDSGYYNRIVTDMVFRIRESTSTATPGGIGEFSVLMDSPIKAYTGGTPTRITMYGNVFIGPGTYQYDVSGAVDPTAADAMHLDSYAYFTQKGDYMIVFGNIRLSGQSVLNVSSGRLTVYGDIILEDDAAFLCTGELYMMDGCDIITTSGNSHNVIPQSLLSTGGVEEVTTESYTDIVTLLGLDDANDADDDDGIVRQILKQDIQVVESGVNRTYDAIELLTNPGNPRDSSSENVFGIDYHTSIFTHSVINRSNLEGSLSFVTGGATMQDGANINATLIGLGQVQITNEKNTVMTQMGSSVFNYFIDTSNSLPTVKLHDDRITLQPGDFFIDDPNYVVNQVINAAANGGSGTPQVDTAVGYENWTKE